MARWKPPCGHPKSSLNLTFTDLSRCYLRCYWQQTCASFITYPAPTARICCFRQVMKPLTWHAVIVSLDWAILWDPVLASQNMWNTNSNIHPESSKCSIQTSQNIPNHTALAQDDLPVDPYSSSRHALESIRIYSGTGKRTIYWQCSSRTCYFLKFSRFFWDILSSSNYPLPCWTFGCPPQKMKFLESWMVPTQGLRVWKAARALRARPGGLVDETYRTGKLHCAWSIYW